MDIIGREGNWVNSDGMRWEIFVVVGQDSRHSPHFAGYKQCLCLPSQFWRQPTLLRNFTGSSGRAVWQDVTETASQPNY